MNRGALSLGLAAALGLSLPGLAQKAEPYAPGAKGASGAVLSYKEGTSANILYLEERGMVQHPVQRPVEGSRRDDMPEIAKARTPDAAPEAAAKKGAAPKTAGTGAKAR